MENLTITLTDDQLQIVLRAIESNYLNWELDALQTKNKQERESFHRIAKRNKEALNAIKDQVNNK